MFDLVKLPDAGVDDYMCGPNTFRELLATLSLNPEAKLAVVITAIGAGVDRRITIHNSSSVPDDGKFYPGDAQCSLASFSG